MAGVLQSNGVFVLQMPADIKGVDDITVRTPGPATALKQLTVDGPVTATGEHLVANSDDEVPAAGTVRHRHEILHDAELVRAGCQVEGLLVVQMRALPGSK